MNPAVRPTGGPARSEAAPGVAVFARAPVPGRAKRRLIPALGDEGAAELQRRMTERIVAAAVEAGIGAVSLWCAPDCRHPSFQALYPSG